MANLMRCRACGYIMDEAGIGGVCPACGLPKTVFEPYDDPVSPKRRFLIDMHLHPIAVHFPQALAALIPVLIIGGWILDTSWAIELLSTARVLGILLPLTVLGALAAGLLDAKTRFRKFGTPLLIKKIALGVVLLVLSVAIGVMMLMPDLGQWAVYVVMALSVACIGCEVLLGKIGSGLMCAMVRG